MTQIESPLEFLTEREIIHEVVASEDLERAFFLYYSAKAFEHYKVGLTQFCMVVGCTLLGIWLGIPLHAEKLGLIVGGLAGLGALKFYLDKTLAKINRKQDYERWMNQLVNQYSGISLSLMEIDTEENDDEMED